MAVFDDWDSLTLSGVEAFLADVDSEPLAWEAKEAWDKRSIRKAVCGFANSHDGGYLLVGVKEREPWEIVGVETPTADPPSDVTDVLRDGGVEPYPDGLDAAPFAVGQGRHLLVVHVPPVATPPCNTRGTVYERVSGKTPPVTDPARLAALFARGDNAKVLARAGAGFAARVLLRHQTGTPQFGLGLAAVGYAPDIASRLFTPRFESVIRNQIAGALMPDRQTFGEPTIHRSVGQDHLRFTAPSLHSKGWAIDARANWDGSVGVHWSQDVDRMNIESTVDRPLRAALEIARTVLAALKPSGVRYLTVAPAGGQVFPMYLGDSNRGPNVERGPLADPSDDDSLLESIRRELERASGVMAFEPEDEPSQQPSAT